MPDKKKPNRYLVLTSIGLQMGVIMFFAAYLGRYLDDKYALNKPICTLVCVLLGLGVSLYYILNQLKKLND